MRQIFGKIRRKVIRILLGRELMNNLTGITQLSEIVIALKDTINQARIQDNMTLITRKTDALTLKTDQLTKKTDTLALKTDGLIQKTDIVTLRTDSFVRKVDGLSQKIEFLSSEAIASSKDTINTNMGILNQMLSCIQNDISQKADSLTKKTDGLSQNTDKNHKLLMENCGYHVKTQNIVVNTIAKTLKRNIIEHLDFLLTDHCNLNCKGCSVFAPLSTQKFADPEVFRADLMQLLKLVGEDIQQIHLLGGEPLLHPQVEQFAIICRSIFCDARIDFTTNGLLIYDMPPSFWKVLRDNNVAIKYTRYPVNFDYDKMIEYVQDMGVNVFSAGGNIKYFRRIPLNTKGTFNIHKSYIQCPYIDCPQLRNGKLYRCPVSAFANVINGKLRAASHMNSFKIHAQDYLDIYQAGDKNTIREFLCNPIPFCQYCDMDRIDSCVPWETSNRDIKEWVDV